jgi:hypothetical protein
MADGASEPLGWAFSKLPRPNDFRHVTDFPFFYHVCY